MRSLPLLLLLCAACFGASWLLGAAPSQQAGTPARLEAPRSGVHQEPAEEAETEDAEDEGRDPRLIRRELEIAQLERQLMASQHTLAAFEHEQRVVEARFAVESARAEQDAFETHRQKAEGQASALDLERMRDEASDAEEEMQQLAQMYGENELADRTAEIVLRRANRELERAREELRLAEEQHRHLVSIAQPREQIELRHAVRAAEIDLQLADLQAETMRLEQAVELAEHDATIEDLRAELAAAEAAAEGR